MSFYKLIDSIKSELKAQRITNTVTFGNLSEVDIDKTTIFPLAHFLTPSVSFNGSTNEFEVRILFLDIVDKDNRFENSFQGNNDLHDILNTQLVAANYISNSIRRGALSNSGYQVTGDPSAEMIIDQYENLLAGWGVTFSVVAKSEDTTCIGDTGPVLPPGQDFNTVIGGLGRSVTTKTELATLLGVSETIIDEFELDGFDISCNFNSIYNIPDNCFNGNLDIESYHDYSNYVDEIGFQAFRSATGLNEFTLEGASEAGTFAFYQTTIRRAVLPNAKIFNNVFQGCALLEYADIRSSVPIGTTASTNNVFTACRDGMELIANIATATNNGGNPDGDVDYVTTTLNGTVTYV